VLFTDRYWDDYDPDVRMYLVPWEVTKMGTKIWSETWQNRSLRMHRCRREGTIRMDLKEKVRCENTR